MILPALYAVRRSYARGMVEVNHVTLFTIGFLAYWIFPIGVVLLLSSQLESTLGDDLMNLYAGAGNMSLYLVLCGVIYLAFIAGDQLGKRQKVRGPGRLKPISEKLLAQFATVAVIIAALALYSARAILLKGSYVTDTDWQQRGTTAAACIFLFIMAMIHIVQNRPATLKGLLLNRYMLLFWPVNLVLFLSGSRLYFISFTLMLIVYWSTNRKRLRAVRLAAILGSAALLMGLVGAYRLGGDGGHSIVANLIAEPMFTSFSLAAFLSSKTFFLLKPPVYLASDMLNLIPSALFPGKVALMEQMPDIYSPLGALNSFVSFQWNFGLIGTAGFMFFLGYGLSRMRRRRELWVQVAYVMTSGWLAFTFFRDPFSISLVKNILEFSLLLPAVIIVVARLVAYAVNGRRALSAGGAHGATAVGS